MASSAYSSARRTTMLLTTRKEQVHPLPSRISGCSRDAIHGRAESSSRRHEVVSLSLLAHGDAHAAEARLFAPSECGAKGTGQIPGDDSNSPPKMRPKRGGRRPEEAVLSPERYAELGAREQFVRGLGKGLRQTHQLL
jgi:hypothetical protein